MRAALFDLDRTLVRKETATSYVRYLQKRGGASWQDLVKVSWWVAQYTFGVLDVPDVAARTSRSLAGTPEAVLSARCDDWFRRDVEPLITDAARRAVETHRTSGDLVAIVTGASPYIARPVARHLGIEHVVASELEVGADGLFTGRIVEPFCYGHGKVTRARALAERLAFRLDEAWFYSDSWTDLPLLEAVHTPVVVNPDPRLSRVARRRAWRVERW
jgi:HAD superfamily hydrolase (TIGR01490 family)